MKKVAFIPARSGSKRFPNKNIKMLGDLPLVCWTLKSFLDSECFDEVIFSSDSEQYMDVVHKYISSDKLKFHLRTKDEAGDKVKIFDYIKRNIDIFCEGGIFSLGLPTCPFRTSDNIKECFDMFVTFNRPVFSAHEYEFPVSFSFSVEGNEWYPKFVDSPMISGNTRSQDQEKFYRPNGGIYIFNSSFIKGDVKTFYETGIPFLMERENCIDIDDEFDFKMAEFLLNYVL